MTQPARDRALLGELWLELNGSVAGLDAVEFIGPELTLPSTYAVSALASASVALASLSVAEVAAAHGGGALPHVSVDRLHAAAAFQGERLLRSVGWELPEPWDPLAGDYALQLGDHEDSAAPAPDRSAFEAWLETADTHFGPVRRVRCPGRIAGIDAHWTRLAGALGSDEPEW